MLLSGDLASTIADGETDVESAQLLASILDLRMPEVTLAAATQVMATGLRAWTGSDCLERASGLGLNRQQAMRLRLCAVMFARMEAEGWAMPAPISGPADVLAHVGDIRACAQERVVALYLDTRNRPLDRELIAVGGLRSSVIQPRDVLAPALRIPAAGLILAHNHPSGDTRPSSEDLEVTKQLAAAAGLLGLQLLDHLVVSRRGYTSLKEMGAV